MQLPVVYIHGLGSSREDLAEVARRAGGRALLPDLPGFGVSSGRRAAASVRAAVDAVLEFLDGLGVVRAVWAGFSYGGHVALRAALDTPDRVAGLALVSSGGLQPRPPAGIIAAFREDALAHRTATAVALACDALTAGHTPASRAYLARRVALHRAGRLLDEYRAIAASAAGALADDAALRLEEVRAPVELIHGALDPLVCVRSARAASLRLPDCRLSVLERCGHMPWLTHPEPVADRVLRLRLSCRGRRALGPARAAC